MPDPAVHGSVEALLYEMDAAGVDLATVVCARIGEVRPPTTTTTSTSPRGCPAPGQAATVADVDCSWRPEYHTPGCSRPAPADRRADPIVGFTHYLKGENDGWLRSDEGREFFGVAAERG